MGWPHDVIVAAETSGRLEGLTDEPRPGTPRTVTDELVVEVITRTLEGPPPATTQWSTRTMAERVGLSKATISRIWQTFGLQSHRVDTFKLSADPQFVEKVRDIVGLYLNPPAHAVVLSVDECERALNSPQLWASNFPQFHRCA